MCGLVGGLLCGRERGGGRHNTTRPVEISDRQKMKKHKQTTPDYEREETKRIKIYQTSRVGKCVCGTETEPNRGK